MSDTITSSAGSTEELRWGAATSSGRIRPGNEDTYLAEAEVFVVADGMGGHQAGEVAAEIATSTLGDRLRHGARSSGVVVAAAIEANAAIFQAAHSNPDQRGMGTTLTAIVRLRSLDEATQPIQRPTVVDDETSDELSDRGDESTLIATPAVELADVAPTADDQTIFDDVDGEVSDEEIAAELEPATAVIEEEDNEEEATQASEEEDSSDDDWSNDRDPSFAEPEDSRLVVVNVGDSRIYVARQRQLKRVTVDHSYVQELLSTGHITEAEARNHPRRNIVTRALGIEPTVRVDSWTLPMVRGDRYLLCSDGLVDEVDDDEINTILLSNDDPQACATALVDAANANGGRDNTTVIVVDVLIGQEPPADDAPLTGELDRAVPDWADDHPNALDPARATAVLPRVGGSAAPAKRLRIGVGSVLFALALLAIIVGVVVAIISMGGDDEGPVVTTTTTIQTTTTVADTTTTTTTATTTTTTPTTPAATSTAIDSVTTTAAASPSG